MVGILSGSLTAADDRSGSNRSRSLWIAADIQRPDRKFSNSSALDQPVPVDSGQTEVHSRFLNLACPLQPSAEPRRF